MGLIVMLPRRGSSAPQTLPIPLPNPPDPMCVVSGGYGPVPERIQLFVQGLLHRKDSVCRDQPWRRCAFGPMGWRSPNPHPSVACFEMRPERRVRQLQ